jgi:internalin A
MPRLLLALMIGVLASCQKPAATPSSSTPSNRNPNPNPARPGPSVSPEELEEKALKHVESLGGIVKKKKESGPGDPPIEVDLSAKKVTDADMKEIGKIGNLVKLYLRETPVTAAGLKELAGLPSLSVLDLTRCREVNDAAMKELAAVQTLGTLILSGTAVTDAGLKELKALKALSNLDLTGTKVTDAGITDIQKALPRCKVKK